MNDPIAMQKEATRTVAHNVARQNYRDGERSSGRTASVILYLDTSAFVPLLIDEPTSRTCGDVWDVADRVVTSRLTYVEAAAALAAAERAGRFTSAEHDGGRELLIDLWPQLDVAELDDQLMAAAAQAAITRGLRGYDSVHYAAAVAIEDEDLVAAADDGRLLNAWRAEGIAIIDTNAAS